MVGAVMGCVRPSPPYINDRRSHSLCFPQCLSPGAGHHHLSIPSSTTSQGRTKLLQPFLKTSNPGPQLPPIMMVYSTVGLGTFHISQLWAHCPHPVLWPGASITDMLLNKAESSLSPGTEPLSFLGPQCLTHSRCPETVLEP